jgi:hypothetical protein
LELQRSLSKWLSDLSEKWPMEALAEFSKAFTIIEGDIQNPSQFP